MIRYVVALGQRLVRNVPIDLHVSWFALACCVVAGLLVFVSWYTVAPVREAWDTLDYRMFYVLNGSLGASDAWLYFWVVAGSRLFDVLPLLLIVGCYISQIQNRPRDHRLFFGIQFFCMLIVMALWQNFVAGEALQENRPSPSKVLTPFIDIRGVLDWVPWVKSGSSQSFPGDHGSVLVYFGVLFLFTLKCKYALIYLLLAPLFCLPRLFSGAHWISDVMVGGLSSGLICAALFLGLRNLLAGYLKSR